MGQVDLRTYNQITDDLRRICDDHGIKDVAYTVELADLKSYFPAKSLTQSLIKCHMKRTTAFETSSNARNYFRSWMRYCRHRDSNLPRLLKESVIEWNYDQPESSSYNHQIDMRNFGYRHKLSLTLPCMICEDYLAAFTLLTAEEAVTERVLQKDSKIVEALEHVHLKTMVRYGPLVNPIAEYALIKPASMRVLKYLGQGLSRLQIAERCCLTQRGVDYHIDVLKQFLLAGNIASLICNAKEKHLI